MNGNFNFPFPFSSVGVWVAGGITFAIVALLQLIPVKKIVRQIVAGIFFLASLALYIALRTETFRGIGDDIGVLLLALAGCLTLREPS